jgi:ABC-2 type transport system ATP-binding protein
VHLQAVRVALGERFALEIGQLTLGTGITVIRGPNGSGKSTLLRVLATVLAPDQGQVTVGGHSLDEPASLTAVRRRLGYLPQADSVPPRLRVFDHVDVVAVMRELDPDPRRRRALVHRALVSVGVDHLASERCGRLSGGERRRVALAAALAGDASLLVLDEPDAWLDDAHRASLATLLRERARTAVVVVTTHDAAWSAALHAGRTLTLAAGRPVPGPG